MPTVHYILIKVLSIQLGVLDPPKTVDEIIKLITRSKLHFINCFRFGHTYLACLYFQHLWVAMMVVPGGTQEKVLAKKELDATNIVHAIIKQ